MFEEMKSFFTKAAAILHPQKPRVIPVYYAIKIPIEHFYISGMEDLAIKDFNKSVNRTIDEALLAHPRIFGDNNQLLDRLLPYRTIASDGKKWRASCPTGENKVCSCGGVETIYDTHTLSAFLKTLRVDLDAHIANYQPNRPIDLRQPASAAVASRLENAA